MKTMHKADAVRPIQVAEVEGLTMALEISLVAR
jgi:hypothetical protein